MISIRLLSFLVSIGTLCFPTNDFALANLLFGKTDGCWDLADKGRSYRGAVSVTISGRLCQPWAAQLPHKHAKTPENYPTFDLEENFCRNPNRRQRPWCFTTDKAKKWEFCAVPRCTTDCWEPENDGANYRGNVKVTVTGKNCQMWDSQTPHAHTRNKAHYPMSGLVENYCRNPDGVEGPWCYTTDVESRWEYCTVPTCSEKITKRYVGCYRSYDLGASYRGQQSTTISGKKCQPWSQQAPHAHTRTEENYPDSNLEKNFCRNPDGTESPWCYTEDNSTRWELCGVPLCTDNCWNEEGEGASYRGFVAKTISGRACQRWDSQAPHNHSRTPQNYPQSGLIENYCRNPDGEALPWCYTTDDDKRWEFCSIPTCVCNKPESFYGCWDPADHGKSYRGLAITSISGRQCLPWNQEQLWDYPLDGLKENFCRNPEDKFTAGCYTSVNPDIWEPCCLTTCTTSCWDHKNDGASYRGFKAKTITGRACQRWDSQYPHKHSRTAENYPFFGLVSNYCRNPDGEPGPWCYTTDNTSRWEFCDIPRCAPGCWNTADGGESYRGYTAITESGNTCQQWISQTPHVHSWYPAKYASLDSNYCRNPGGIRDRPWCMTSDPSRRWEYCSIPTCFT